MNNRTGLQILAVLGALLLIVVAWTLTVPARRIDVTAEPNPFTRGSECTVHVRFVNALGFEALRGGRGVTFTIEQGKECGELVPGDDPHTIRVHAIRDGEIVIRIDVEGVLLPYQITLRVSPALAQR